MRVWDGPVKVSVPELMRWPLAVMHAGRIGGSKAMKPAEDKAIDEPEGDKVGVTVASSAKRGK
jgi:hypothetical protein